MNKFAKLKAVNRLLVKIAADSAVPAQQTAAKPMFRYKQKFAPKGTADVLQAPVVGTGDRGAGFGTWDDMFNVSAPEGYAYKAFNPYNWMSWMKRKWAPGKTSMFLQNLRAQRPADVTLHDKSVPIQAVERAMKKTVPQIGKHIEKQTGMTQQAIKDNYPWISNISNAKRYMMDPGFLVQAGVLRPGHTSQQYQNAKNYWFTRGSELLSRYADRLGLTQQQAIEQGYRPTPGFQRSLFRDGHKKGKRRLKFINFNASNNRPTTAVPTNYMQNNTTVG